MSEQGAASLTGVQGSIVPYATVLSARRLFLIRVQNPDGRSTGEGKRQDWDQAQVDRKIDTLVNKYPQSRLHHKKYAAEDPFELQTAQDRRADILVLNMIAPVLRKTCFPTTPHQRSTIPPPRHINVSSVAVKMNNEAPLHLYAPCHSLHLV